MAKDAGLAQAVAQGIRNAQGPGSNPGASSRAYGESALAAGGVSGEDVGFRPAAAAGDGAQEAFCQGAEDGAPLSGGGQGEERKDEGASEHGGDGPREVRCSVCGRPLRSPESIARGMGRDCWRKSRRKGRGGR